MKIVAISCLILAAAACASTVPSESARNEAVARRVFDEILSQGKFDLAAQLYAPDFVNHGRNRDVSLEVDQAAARGWKQASPDLVLRPEIVIAEGDRVAVLWRGRGTNTGSGNGIPATGKRVVGRGITIWRIVNGRVTEEWSEFSRLEMMQQLGLVPGGEPVGPEWAEPRPIPRAKPGLSIEQRERNRRLVTSVFEQILGDGRTELARTNYADSFANHGLRKDRTVQDQIDTMRGLRQLAPDLNIKVTQSIADGDLVAVVYVVEGTRTVAAPGYPATGKKFKARGMSIMRVGDGGRITDEWSMFDQSQMLEQSGMLPPAGAAKPPQ